MNDQSSFTMNSPTGFTSQITRIQTPINISRGIRRDLHMSPRDSMYDSELL